MVDGRPNARQAVRCGNPAAIHAAPSNAALSVTTSSANDSSPPPADDRLGSWKAIAAYVKRDVTTVQRWERREGMPVHRHLHDKRGSIYAFRSELDAWLKDRALQVELEPPSGALAAWPRWWLLGAVIAAIAVVGGAVFWWTTRLPDASANPLLGARITLLTDFEGLEQAAALSPDGRFVAFLSDRDGKQDAWITQVGTGEFQNLTKGDAPELVNPEVRSVGFTPDGSLVTLWTRVPRAAEPVNMWAAPPIGGSLRTFRIGAVEMAWSSDGKRRVFHTTAPGDPMFILESNDSAPRPIYAAAPGEHNHFQIWSPDDKHIYFVRGVPPDHTDIWRIAADGGDLQRITSRDARVLYPTFLDERTLLYLATAEDGSGPWLYVIDVHQRVPRRVSFGVESYTSLAASADRLRLVVTVERGRSSLWRIPIREEAATEAAAQRIELPTTVGFSPRVAQDSLLFVRTKNDGHSIAKFADGKAVELWSAPRSRVLGGPAIAPDGARIAFAAEDERGTHLYVTHMDQLETRRVNTALAVRGSPVWSPEGDSLTVAAQEGDRRRLYRLPLDGSKPTVIVDADATSPLWSPDGRLLVYAEADSGPEFTLGAVHADGRPHPLPEIRIPRGPRRFAFVPGQRALVVLLGEMQHGNFWYVDLDTGARRQLTDFKRSLAIRDFDVSADGRELVFDRREADADIALIELARR
jgi:Tol biopolymer transport system component